MSIVLPRQPDDSERVLYVKRHLLLVAPPLALAFAGLTYGVLRVTMTLAWGGVFEACWCFFALCFVVSAVVNWAGRDFDLAAHDRLVAEFRPNRMSSVDVWLPNCGEPIEVLRNTWEHVRRLDWTGALSVYCLDDVGRPEVRALAREFGFQYLSRPDKGWMKKAGNLRFAYERSDGELILLLDADFCPRPDVLAELAPYMSSSERVAIVQTAQYFRSEDAQGWVAQGAAALQEYFYRVCQWSREQRGAAICCGTNALYRRAALDENGGMTLVPQGEDMRTGFDLTCKGWRVQYLPLNLAAGLCPTDLAAHFKQQYRWCTGSLRLLGDEAFWASDMALSTRLCYVAGFIYYLQAALTCFVVPALIVLLLVFEPGRFAARNDLLVVPCLFVLVIIYPLWHHAHYRLGAWSARIVCQWSYAFAIVDFLFGRVIPWDATGAKTASVSSSRRFRQFCGCSLVWNVVLSIAWVGATAYRVGTGDVASFTVVAAMGVLQALSCGWLAWSFTKPELRG